ncbi:MAG: ArsR family transcriptional regulator [Myxococcota bacterium]
MTDKLAELEARIAAVEAILQPEEGELDLGLITRLRRVEGEAAQGAIQLAGSVDIGGRRAAWQTIHASEELVTFDPEPVARVLSALGHPIRLQIVLSLLAGPRKASDLEVSLDVGSTGKLYHHLKELVSAGVVVQPRRSEYVVPTPGVIPVLAAIAVVSDLIGPTNFSE